MLEIYDKYYDIHASDIGHYFRNMYHIVEYIDSSPYFSLITSSKDFFQQKDYMKILRAQLTNNEIACLAVNGLSTRGFAFRPLIEKYQLLRNLHFDINITKYGYLACVPAPEILINAYPHLKSVFEQQNSKKKQSGA